MSSQSLDDATPVLVQKYGQVKAMFEGNLPAWMLRIECTLRGDAEQQEAHDAGLSKLDPSIPAERLKARHLPDAHGKSNAIDVEIYSRSSGRSADKLLNLGLLSDGSYDLLYLVLMLIVERFGLRSGNDWNRDGISVGPDAKEKFFDGGHMEIPV